MNLNDVMKQSFYEIVKQKNYDGGKILKDYIDELGGWPIAYSKQHALKAIKMLLDEDLPFSAVQALLDISAGVARKMPELNEKQIAALKDMRKFIEDAAMEKECAHENAGIGPFLHGGGFTPDFALPEFVCPDCGLNVTLGVHRMKKEDAPLHGVLDITEEDMEKLEAWAAKCRKKNEKGKYVISSTNLAEDVFRAWEDTAYKWDGPMPKILDKERFELQSGV